jgi:hypothetical protein
MEATSAPTGERDPRKCTHANADGELCKGWKVSASSYCAGHSGLGIAASHAAASAASAQSARSRQRKAQVAKRRAVDVYRENVERDAEEFYALKLECARDKSAPWSERLRAASELENRGLGKPVERTEDVTAQSETVEALEAMTMAERNALLARMEQTGRLTLVRDDSEAFESELEAARRMPSD